MGSLHYPNENYHQAVINLKAENPYAGQPGTNDAYLEGHRDARHKSAELANSADAEIRRLKDLLRRSLLNITGDNWRDLASAMISDAGATPLVEQVDPLWIAMLQHSPESTAVGIGATKEEAAAALLEAYPNGCGRELSIARITPGKGFSDIENANLECAVVKMCGPAT